MSTSIRPSWTDNAAVVALATLALNGVSRATLDLSIKFGAYLILQAAKKGTTALTNGVDVIVRRTVNAGGIVHPGEWFHGLMDAPASQVTTINVDVALGATTLNVVATASWAAGDVGVISDGADGAGDLSRVEWFRVARVTDATHLLIDAPTQFAHTAAQADKVRNKAAAFPPLWCPGGAKYEVIFDYGDDAAGESVLVRALAQTYDLDMVT